MCWVDIGLALSAGCGVAGEQAGRRRRIALVRNAVEGRMFSAADKSETDYHGAVWPTFDDPYRRLENAWSELEPVLLPSS